MSDERPNDERRLPPLATWDRTKWLMIFGLVFVLLVFDGKVRFSNLSWLGAIDHVMVGYRWLPTVLAFELLRQMHYLLTELSPRYGAFWREDVVGAITRQFTAMTPWQRFRAARAAKWVGGIVGFMLLLGILEHKNPLTATFELAAALWAALPLVLQIAFAFLFGVAQFLGIYWFMSKGGIEVYQPGEVRTRFDDVLGQDHVVERVRENIIFLQEPESIEARGGYVPGGILLWGPPGTGKTLLAEAVAGETGKPYVFVDPGAFSNMFMGVGVLKVKALFRRLRKLSLRHGGVVVFFDEADALGSRGSLHHGAAPGAGSGADACNGSSYLEAPMSRADATMQPGTSALHRDGMVVAGGGTGELQALLAELSGLKKPRGFFNRYVRKAFGMEPKPPPKYRMLVMMATNMRHSLDEALLRPGRIDRMYKVGYPSKVGRIGTYAGYLSKVEHDLSDADIDKLATITPYATGAFIKDLVNESLINAVRDGRSVVTWNDITKARQAKALGPPEGVEYIDRERHATAIHEACHAVAAYRQRHHLVIDMATIEKSAEYLGMVSSIRPEDQFAQWRSEYESDIIVALASLAGERMFFGGDHSSGVSGDLHTATKIAAYMEGSWGMGSTVAAHDVLRDLGISGPLGPTSRDGEGPRFDPSLAPRIEAKLNELLDRTQQLLVENRTQVLAVAHALETYKTISGDDVMAIIEGREGPLVDGRRYARPEFTTMAEAYHDQALQAHRNHGAIPVPMPTTADWDVFAG